MLQNEDDKIRNAVDRLSNLSLSPPSIGAKITSWWQGFSIAFTTTTTRPAFLVEKEITPKLEQEQELKAPVQKTMDEKVNDSLVSLRLERQESFIVEPPACDCPCGVPVATCDVPEAACDVSCGVPEATCDVPCGLPEAACGLPEAAYEDLHQNDILPKIRGED